MKIHSLGYLLREGIKSLWKNRTMSFASICVLFSCLFMMGIASLLSMNLSGVMKSVEGNNTITVFLQDSIPTLKSIQLGDSLDKIENINIATFIPKKQGLINLLENMEGGEKMLQGLPGTGEFLPDAYQVSLKNLGDYEKTYEEISAIDGVDSITDYSEVASKLISLDQLVRYGSIAIVLVLGVISLFIISNTIKVTMFSRRAEVAIMKSVGATNSFIRVPFIVEGVFIGILAGALSSALLFVAYRQIIGVISDIVPYLFVGIDISPVMIWIALLFVVLGALFGVLGCGISIGRYLKKEGEEAMI